ncbi:hypothetical protein ES703_37677 [subsurface metagenome]
MMTMMIGSGAVDELKEKEAQEAPWGVIIILGIFAYGAYLWFKKLGGLPPPSQIES